LKSQDAHFDQVADQYDATIPEHVIQHLTSRRVQLAESLKPEGKVLDVGCGTGRFLSSLSARYTTTGVDISAGMLAIAREKGVQVERASSAELPFDDDSFDLVTTFAVLHHLIDPEVVRASLREMARVVRPAGAVVVWDHNPLNPYWRYLMSKAPQDQGDERLVPARLIVDTLRRAGLRDIDLRRMTFTPDFTPPTLLSTVARVERVLERVPLLRLLAAHNVAVGHA
jgi:SAM-dependent methyltransferase